MKYCCLAVVLAASVMGGPAMPPLNARPRIIMDDARISKIKNYIATDSFAKGLSTSVIDHADSIVPLPVLPEPTPGPSGILVAVRGEVDRLYSLTLAWRLTGNETYATRAVEELLDVSGWSTWNPPHFLDVAEMMHGASVAYDSLYGFMNESARATVAEAIAVKGLTEYLNGVKDKQWWYSTEWNWGGVCNGGAIVAALNLGDDPKYGDLAKEAFSLALDQNGIFQSISGYGSEGSWKEGCVYNGYMTRLVVDADAALTTAVGTDMGFNASVGYGKSCYFTIYCDAPGLDMTFDWADAELDSGPQASMLYLAEKFNAPACAVFARYHAATAMAQNAKLGSSVNILSQKNAKLGSSVNILSRQNAKLGSSVNILSRQLLFYTPMGSQSDFDSIPLGKVYEEVGMATARSDWNFSVYDHIDQGFAGWKGGDNTWNHNHLDLGSFVFYRSGIPVALDLGAGSYALPDYFGPKRWTYYRTNSSGHNVIMFDDNNQNTQATANTVSFNTSASIGAWGVVNTTDAYTQNHATLTQRGVAIVQNYQQLITRDEFTFSPNTTSSTLSWNMHTPCNISILSPTSAKLTFLIPSDGRVITNHAYVVSPDTQCSLQASYHPVQLAPPQRPATGMNKLVFSTTSPNSCKTIVIALGTSSSGIHTNPLAEWASKGPLQ